MQTDPILARIRLGASVMMMAVTAHIIWYAWRSFGKAWRFCFGQPEQWETHWRVDEGSVIGTGLRTFHFANWSALILISIAAAVAAILLMNAFRTGDLFSKRVARRTIWVGILLLTVQLSDMVFAAITPWTITLGNEKGPEPIWWYYNAGNLKAAVLGAIVLLFGQMMHRAIQVDAENKGFV